MLFKFRRRRDGTRQVRAELHRERVRYSSGWHDLPAEGMGIEARRAAWEDVTTKAANDVRVVVAAMYSGEE